MRKKTHLIALLVITGLFQSCLFPGAPKYHYFTSSGSTEKMSPKLQIFSTPGYKQYIITNVDVNTSVFIQSSVFENPDEFYLMKNEILFGQEAKQFEVKIKDRKFYRDGDYKNIRLKIIDGDGERTIVYNMNKKISGSR